MNFESKCHLPASSSATEGLPVFSAAELHACVSHASSTLSHSGL